MHRLSDVVAIVVCLVGFATGDTPVLGQGVPFDECGRIVKDDVCVFFCPLEVGFPLCSAHYAFDNIGEFSPGDTVQVVGTLEWCAHPFCSSRGCIRDNTIARCPATSMIHSTWGSVKAMYR